MNDLTKAIEAAFSHYLKGEYIKSDKLPDIDLYVDQITTLLSRELAPTMRHADDKIMTKTMINNYSKNHLLPPPYKKKYNRDHILFLILIYYFKSFMSISDIQKVLGPLADKYFNKEKDPMADIYETLFSEALVHADDVYNKVMKEYDHAKTLFEGEKPEDRAYLQKFALICMLSYDIYIKKQVIEHIIDDTF